MTYYTRSDLLRRGWSDELIDKHLARLGDHIGTLIVDARHVHRLEATLTHPQPARPAAASGRRRETRR